jgi:hypothetical protein
MGLPTGANRGYNLVVIDDDYTSCRIHVRESIQGNQFGRYTRGIFKVDGYARAQMDAAPVVKVRWQPPAASRASTPRQSSAPRMPCTRATQLAL